MESKTKFLTIIVPCYNHEKYITQCIESIVNQTFKNFNLIVIDDGSKDNSPQVLKELQKKYLFNLILQENVGVAVTLNKALQMCSDSKYVTFCASDDYWALNKLELQVNFMNVNPEIPMCYGKVHYVNEQSEIINEYDSQNNILKGGRVFDDILTFSLHPAVTYFYKRCVFDEIGYYNSTIFAEDYYMNLKIASKYNIGFINEYVGYYRVDSAPTKVIRFKKVSDSHLQTIELYKNHPKYNLAKKLVYLRMFHHFAPYKEYKKIAFENGVKAIGLCYKLQYMKALIKFLIFFK